MPVQPSLMTRAAEKPELTETDEDKANLIELRNLAIKDNPPGIYIIDPDFSANVEELAGYLGLSFTIEFHQLLYDSPIRPKLLSWIDSRNKGFSLPGVQSGSLWPATNFFAELQHPDFGRWLSLNPIPDRDDFIVRARRGWISWGQTIQSIFRRKLSVETDPSKDPTSYLTDADFKQYIDELQVGSKEAELRYMVDQPKDEVFTDEDLDDEDTLHRALRLLYAKRVGEGPLRERPSIHVNYDHLRSDIGREVVKEMESAQKDVSIFISEATKRSIDKTAATEGTGKGEGKADGDEGLPDEGLDSNRGSPRKARPGLVKPEEKRAIVTDRKPSLNMEETQVWAFPETSDLAVRRLINCVNEVATLHPADYSVGELQWFLKALDLEERGPITSFDNLTPEQELAIARVVDTMSDTQKAALEHIKTSRHLIILLQGPPGTGEHGDSNEGARQ
ncbi:MAG: hypothetical protein Q9209_002412 [Squamulea sp. 1 TL-2023]